MDRRVCLSGCTRHLFLCDESARVELALSRLSLLDLTGDLRFFLRLRVRVILETTRMQLQETVKSITEGPIVQSQEAWPPLSTASLRCLESSAGPSGRARIHPYRTRRELVLCLAPVVLAGCARKPPREAPASGWTPIPIFRSSGILLPGSGSTTTKNVPVPTSGWVQRELMHGPSFGFR